MCLYDTPSSYFCKTTCWVSDYSVGNLRIQTLPHSGFVHVNSTCNSGRPSTISYRLLVSTIWLLQKKQISFIWTKFYVNNMRLSEHRVIKLLTLVQDSSMEQKLERFPIAKVQIIIEKSKFTVCFFFLYYVSHIKANEVSDCFWWKNISNE